ncbi:MAG: murein biosynthesis integral membrane protein MurJ [Pseudomonadota bacterium]
MNLARAFVTVSGLTLVSRVLGYARDVLFAALLGTGLAADAFFVAFKLPNFFRRLFAEGAFSAAFVPMFAGKLETDGNEAARRLASDALAMLVACLLVIVLLAEIAMPLVMSVLAPGFRDQPEKFALAVELTRITFPYLLLVSMVALLGGMLNSAGRFAAFAAAPILLNLSLIVAALLARHGGTEVAETLAWGISAGGVAQLIMLLVGVRRAGLMPRIAWPRLTADVKKVLKLFGPAALGAGAVQLNLVVDIVIASLLPTGAISYLYYADRLNQLPLGVVGIAVGTALLPLLSRQLKAGDENGALISQNRAIEMALFFTIPAAVAFVILADPIIAVLFQRGAFTAEATAATGAALVAFSLGLPAYVLIKVFTPGFFARQDTKTPVKIAVVALVTNLVFNLILMGPLAHVGIALATAIAAWVNAALLFLVLKRRGQIAPDARLLGRLPRTLLATAVMAVVLWLGLVFGMPLVSGRFAFEVPGLAVLIAGGLAFFAVTAHLTGAVRLGEILRLLRRSSVNTPSA